MTKSKIHPQGSSPPPPSTPILESLSHSRTQVYQAKGSAPWLASHPSASRWTNQMLLLFVYVFITPVPQSALWNKDLFFTWPLFLQCLVLHLKNLGIQCRIDMKSWSPKWQCLHFKVPELKIPLSREEIQDPSFVSFNVFINGMDEVWEGVIT